MTVKSVTETTITMNVSLTYGGGVPYYSESTIPRNLTMGWTYDLSNLPSNFNVTKVGTETITTKWGSRSVDHYTITISGSTGTIDMWIRSGIAMKIQTTIMNQSMTVTLTDTNISQITNA
jgi:hypothetical protein